MKKYKKNGATGQAGEYYFAYWMVRNFKWPCRLLDIDVGIDAQVEIFENEISSGDFFAVQIKSTVENDPDMSIDLSDFMYWQQLESQVILVRILMGDNHSEPVMYWKSFSKEYLDEIVIEMGKTGFQSKKVFFSESDKLTSESKDAWKEAILSDTDKRLIRVARSLLECLKEHDFDNFVEEDYHLQDENKDFISFNSEIDTFNNHFIDYEELIDAVYLDRRLIIRAPFIGEVIDYFEENESILLYMFNHAFNGIKEGRTPNEILPRNLSREIKKQTEDWVYHMTGF
ncbi:DUF4365 domain-containing protein [Enterobacter hormaechei]|uniref:DUF4365 domain-containing protein n=1 Tax=Enterobacter hormaechei TaxID=158836 RepID=A0ABD7L1F5_9ENTR|nr:DUF4365 domain-containing protein [Enterobacter hormaechei]EDI2224303.1 DUF4365 domain-containing protein [Salmonella enterica subsp. enterica serovar Newport]HDW1502016.1 DUF4365 domain-containing protein [Escherichia coli]MBW7607639.1 DUF4365 domain-containing protein [Enterobacter hormaechei]MBW7662001.1 DUF4365 domain-containing protein [Enterobacter hormaechei]SAF06842.1 Uncharacterised protein [Enterobacter hormaechei]